MNQKFVTAILALSAVLAISALAQAQSSTGQQTGLANPSFEEPRVEKGRFVLVETMPGWKTTDTQFEIWGTGFKEVPAHEGTQFVELNAHIDGILYQDSTRIQRGSVLEFTFAHRGRSGKDTMKLTITDLGADNSLDGGDDTVLFTKAYTTGKDAWAVYTSTKEQKIKALGNTVRFAYGAISTATGELGEGNLLDAANFGIGVVSETLEANKIHAGIQNSYEVYGKDLGFGSPDELRDSVLGDPIRIYIWGLDDLEKLGKGDNPLTLMVDAKEVIYPIYSGGMFKSSITLIPVDGKWTFASFGGAEARMADSTRSKHMNATKREPKNYVVVNVPGMEQMFLGYEEAKKLFLIPCHKHNLIDFKLNVGIPAVTAVQAMQPHMATFKNIFVSPGEAPPKNAMKLDVDGGAFTFGYRTTAKPGFTEFPNTDSPHPGIKRRNRADGEYFSYAQNTRDTELKAQETSLVHYPAKSEGSGVLCPGQNPGDVAIARFTAMNDGEYHYKITAQLIEEDPTGAGVTIYVNDQAVAETQLKKHLVPWTTSSVVKLTKGQTFDIVVDSGEDKNWEKDHVLVTAKAWTTGPSIGHEGIAGSYKEKSGGEMQIRKSDDAKKEAGPWRFVLTGEGDWACSAGHEAPPGGEAKVYFIEFAEGPYKGGRYNIVRDKDGKVKELQLVGGSKAIWVRQQMPTPPTKPMPTPPTKPMPTLPTTPRLEINVLDMTVYAQQTNCWCWAGTGEMIMSYLGVPAPQCEQASKVHTGTNCCGNPTPTQCVKGHYPDFPKYGLKNTGGSKLTFDQIREQIDAKQPIAFNWAWTGGGAHWMVLSGYKVENGIQMVKVLDPWLWKADKNAVTADNTKWMTYTYWLSSPKHNLQCSIYDIKKN